MKIVLAFELMVSAYLIDLEDYFTILINRLQFLERLFIIITLLNIFGCVI